MPARMAFCWTAAAVRPSFFATCPVGVPALARDLRVLSSRALQDAPSFGGRLAISHSPCHPNPGGTWNHTPIQRETARRQSLTTTIFNMLEVATAQLLTAERQPRRGRAPHKQLADMLSPAVDNSRGRSRGKQHRRTQPAGTAGFTCAVSRSLRRRCPPAARRHPGCWKAAWRWSWDRDPRVPG
jgi:hypothetical protein